MVGRVGRYTGILLAQNALLVVEVRGIEPLPVMVGTPPGDHLPPVMGGQSSARSPELAKN